MAERASFGRPLMTLLLILGAIALLYLVRFLFRLTALALPLSAGLMAATLSTGSGFSFAAGLAAFVAGLLLLLIGRLIIASSRSPLIRTGVATMFAAPAAIAGYQMARGLTGLVIGEGVVLTLLSLAGAMTAALSSWRSLVGPGESTESRPDAASGPRRARLHGGD